MQTKEQYQLKKRIININKTALKTLFIFTLIFVGMTGFMLRNIPDLSNYLPASIVSIAEPANIESDTEYTWDSHIKSVTSLVKTTDFLNVPTLSVFVLATTFVLTLISKRFYLKSHIEYCGKKMVKAIMLQWRPN